MQLEEIKKNGARKAVADEIEGRIHTLTNKTFEDYRRGRHFEGLGAKINEALSLLDEMRTLLDEANKLDGFSN